MGSWRKRLLVVAHHEKSLMISRRLVHERWRVAHKALLDDRSRLRDAISESEHLAVSGGQTLELARRAERIVAGSASLSDSGGALERFFSLAPADEGRSCGAGERLVGQQAKRTMHVPILRWRAATLSRWAAVA